MLFDDSISDKVSLPKILDCMIAEGEKPSTIVSFLSGYDRETIGEMIGYSCYSPRMFNIDFIRHLSYNETMAYYRLVKDFNYNCLKYLCWQVLQSDMNDMTKSIFRNLLKRVAPNLRHPYGGFLGTEMKAIDGIFSRTSDIDEICDAFNAMNFEIFGRFCSNISHSLWINRLFQLDFFMGLETKRQYVFIVKALETYSTPVLEVMNKLVFQILKADVDVGIKEVICERCRNSEILIPGPRYDELMSMINSSVSYSELSIRASLIGMDYIVEDLIYILLMNRSSKCREFLEDMCEMDRELVEENFDICELVDKWRKRRS